MIMASIELNVVVSPIVKILLLKKHLTIKFPKRENGKWTMYHVFGAICIPPPRDQNIN